MATAERTMGDARAGARSGLRIHALDLPLVELATGLAIFVVALLVYNATLSPSLSYESFDGNELATVPYQLGLAHSTGYPLYTWVGKLFTFLPFGDVAHRVNLMSAAGAAGGSALLFGALLMLVRGSEQPSQRAILLSSARHAAPYFGAITGALMLAFSTTLWSQAVIAEVYAPNVFMVGLTFLLLVVWGRHESGRLEIAAAGGEARVFQADGKSLALFGAFGLAFGLSLGTHMSNLALAPGFVAYVLLTNWRLALQPKFVLAGALAFGLGVLQFAWLPYRSSGINDAFMARNTPDDLQGIYNYTLNAFPQFKWAFPLSAVPDRVAMYLDFLAENFRWSGIGLATIGGLGMALRNPRAFFLFAPAYLAQMAFFLEYRVTDIDVFYLTAHFIVAAFIGYGAWVIADAALSAVTAVTSAAGAKWAPRIAAGLVSLLLAAIAVQPAISLAASWDENDQSANTGINDFYENVFERLPPNSTLIGRGGVFGYDMFYWRYVYGLRPDVDIPLARGFDTNRTRPGSPTFTVAPPGAAGTAAVGPGRAPAGLQQQNAWYWPVLAAPVQTDASGFQLVRQLTLYEAKSEPPPLFVSSVTPERTINVDFGSVTLVGYNVGEATVVRGGTLHIKLYWRLNGNTRPQVATRVGETEYYESHELGFGNLQRMLGQLRPGQLVVEEYDLVVLSSLDGGEQSLRIRVSGGAFGQTRSSWVEIGRVSVK